ncbi:unnamed protein product, partial [Rotaria sp. Silwood2]
ISIIVYLFIEHINRRAYELLNEIEYCRNRSIEKQTHQLTNATIFELNNQITEQINSVVEQSRKYISLQNLYGATTYTEWVWMS